MSKVSKCVSILVGVLPLAIALAQGARAQSACTDQELTAQIQGTVNEINSHNDNGVCGGAKDGVLLFSTSLSLLEHCKKDSPQLREMRATFRKSLDEALEQQAGACSE